MKKSIVITSIFEPSIAIKKFSELKEYELIVIGDKKTPKEWTWQNVEYLSIDQQENLNFRILKTLPMNHYCRKMIGYLIAAGNGSDFIVDTDDDNIPYEKWGFPNFDGKFKKIQGELSFINVYQLFTNEKIWPRGLPLNLIHEDFQLTQKIEHTEVKVGVWQGLADEDPDVDAIYRLTNDGPCYFNTNDPVVLGQGTVCPFNSQNTMIIKELFPLLYLPCFVTFRFTDILRGLVAQPIMWLHGFHLGFTNATVIQKRNEHDYIKDLISEVPMYESAALVIKIVQQAVNKSKSISENLFLAYEALHKVGIVQKEELVILNDWLIDIDAACHGNIEIK